MVTERNRRRQRTTGEQRSAQIKRRRKLLREKAPEHYLWQNTQRRAIKKGLDFNLERTDLVVPDRCPVLGLILDFGVHHSEPNYPTVDRVDNRFGYVKGNVRVISWRANWLKGNATVDELRKLVLYMEGKL